MKTTQLGNYRSGRLQKIMQRSGLVSEMPVIPFQYSRRRVVDKVGSSKGQQDGAIKFSLLLYLAN